MVRQIGTTKGGDGGRNDALIGLMHRSYEEIRAIEVSARICVGTSDLRPRIEHFHDAVRALTEHPDAMYQAHTRLSVEWLTYDLGMLRYVQDKPLAKLNRSAVMGSTQQIARRGDKPVAVSLPANTKAALSEHYRTYTVFFAALFAEAVERNFQARVASMDEEVEDLAQIEQMLSMLEQGQGNVQEAQVEELIQHLSNEELRDKLMMLMHQIAMRKRERVDAAKVLLRAAMKAVDGQIATLDKAHTRYLSGQLVVLQDAKDLAKKLSGQGLNLAGKFLENAIKQAGQGQGRGF